MVEASFLSGMCNPYKYFTNLFQEDIESPTAISVFLMAKCDKFIYKTYSQCYITIPVRE